MASNKKGKLKKYFPLPLILYFDSKKNWKKQLCLKVNPFSVKPLIIHSPFGFVISDLSHF